jgi:hypothetical protein
LRVSNGFKIKVQIFPAKRGSFCTFILNPILEEDFRNKIPDFRLQAIGCDGIIVWRLTSYCSRFPKATINRVVVHRLCRGRRDDLRSGFADRERSMGSGGIGESRDIAAERVKFLSESVKKPETCRIFVSGKFRFYDYFGKKN